MYKIAEMKVSETDLRTIDQSLILLDILKKDHPDFIVLVKNIERLRQFREELNEALEVDIG